MSRPAALLVSLGLGLLSCSSAPLPADLARAQALEAARRDEDALRAYRAAQAPCTGGAAPSRRPRDDCGLAAFREAQLLERLERFADAAAAFLAVRDRTTDGRLSARALLRAALLFAERLGNKDEALRLCRLIITRWPDEIPAEDALRLLCRLREQDAGQARDLGRELDQLAESLRAHEVSGFALLHRAGLAERDGDVATAVARYDELWRRFPRGPLRDDAAFRAGQALRRAGRAQEAAVRLERLQETFTSSIIVGHYNKLLLDDAALLLGEIYLDDLRQPARALRTWQGMLRRQPTSLLADDALLHMARAALARSTPPGAPEKNEACGYLRRLLRDYPDGSASRRAREQAQALSCGD